MPICILPAFVLLFFVSANPISYQHQSEEYTGEFLRWPRADCLVRIITRWPIRRRSYLNFIEIYRVTAHVGRGNNSKCKMQRQKSEQAQD
jgi:hypothetical protein